MRKKKELKFKTRKQIAIIVDGECEFWYFEMMKRNESTLNVTLKPKLPQKKRLSEQYNEIIESAKHFDNVFWVVDFDKINEEDRTKSKGQKSTIQEFKEYQIKLSKVDNVKIIVNNPCLEFWFLLHFEKTSRFFDSCEGASKQLKKYLKDYEKTQKYFTKKDNDIYLKLLSIQNKAIEHSKSLGNFNINSSKSAISEMFEFFEKKHKLFA